MTTSYATGNVTGGASANQMGGLVGENEGPITASYATGRVTGGAGATQVGGLVGWNNLTSITASYATGRVTGGTGANSLGGLVGINSPGTITESFWDTITSGQGDSNGGTGKSTSQLQAPTQYTGTIYANWNVDLDGDSSIDDPWEFGTSAEYPVLKVDFDGDGDATWQEFGMQRIPPKATLMAIPPSTTPGSLARPPNTLS